MALAAASATTRIKLAIGICRVVERDPRHTPEAGDLDQLKRTRRSPPTHSHRIADLARQHLDGFAESRVDEIRRKIA